MTYQEATERYQLLQTLCQVGIAIFSILATLCVFGAYYFGMKKEDMIKIEKYQVLLTSSQVGIAIFCILTILCTFGAYHYGTKKETVTKIEEPLDNLTNLKPINSYQIAGDYVQGRKVHEINRKDSKVEKNNTEVINAPSALIVTKNQTGGQNTVNYIGGKLNPANLQHKPIFEYKGYYGDNILNEKIDAISKDSNYSFAAKIPDNTKINVQLLKIGEDKSPLWSMLVSSKKNWEYSIYKDGMQQYNLDEAYGDLNIIFRDTGSAILKIYFNDTLINEKIIIWK